MIKKKKIIRLTENELHGIVENAANRILRESRNDDEICLAQKELHKMGGSLSSIGMRLEGTQFHKQYLRMRDEMATLNNALIEHIRRNRK